MDTSSSGSETQSREMATSVCAQFVSRADARQTAIQGSVGGSESLSHSNAPQHRLFNLHWQRSRGRQRQSWNRSGRPEQPPRQTQHLPWRLRSKQHASESRSWKQQSSPPPMDATIHRPCDEANRGSGQSSRNGVDSFEGAPCTIAPFAAGSRCPGFSGARVCHSRNDRHWCQSCNFEGRVGKTEAERDVLRAPQQMVDTPTAERSVVVRVPRSMTAAGSGPPAVTRCQ